MKPISGQRRQSIPVLVVCDRIAIFSSLPGQNYFNAMIWWPRPCHLKYLANHLSETHLNGACWAPYKHRNIKMCQTILIIHDGNCFGWSRFWVIHLNSFRRTTSIWLYNFVVEQLMRYRVNIVIIITLLLLTSPICRRLTGRRAQFVSRSASLISGFGPYSCCDRWT